VWNPIMIWVEHVNCMGERRVIYRVVYRVLLGKPEGDADVEGSII